MRRILSGAARSSIGGRGSIPRGCTAQLYPRLDSGRLEALVAAGGLQSELDSLAGLALPRATPRYHAACTTRSAGALLVAALAADPQWPA